MPVARTYVLLLFATAFPEQNTNIDNTMMFITFIISLSLSRQYEARQQRLWPLLPAGIKLLSQGLRRTTYSGASVSLSKLESLVLAGEDCVTIY